MGREEAKAPQVKTQGPELPTDCPDHAYNQAEGISFQSRVELQADNIQLVHSTGANVSVMALHGCKSSPQKSRPLESGHRRCAVWIAIEYSYKLGQKMNLNFCASYSRLVFAETITYIMYILSHIAQNSIGGKLWQI